MLPENLYENSENSGTSFTSVTSIKTLVVEFMGPILGSSIMFFASTVNEYE